MNGIQLSVCIPGADAGTIVNAARLAESFNLDIWIGDPYGQARTCDDSYLMTTAAAVAAVTSHIRIGVFLTLNGSAEILRLAEDIGVVDQASRGRLELGLVAPDAAAQEWEHRARRLLGAWHDWPAGDERRVSATPRPAQPWMSRLVAGGAGVIEIADRLRGGVVVLDEHAASSVGSDTAQRRVVMAVAPAMGAGGVRAWLAERVLDAMVELRDRADRVGAHEVLFLLPDAGPSRLVADLEALGIVVGTSLRCARHKLAFLAPDAWNWLTELRHLHHAPQ
jgi:alkanesulfonate monooxygenase SsuD/methylene tetrahydromethanopterin reductase-like flavin-dependent oxidoreductase (luciferase family)